jgi:thiamine kinase-like enzyme
MHNSAITEITFHDGDDKPELSTLNFHEHLPEDLIANPMQDERAAKTKAGPPLTVDDLTTDWVQQAMSPYTGGATITAIDTQVIGVSEGFMGQLARVGLTYADEPSQTPHSIIAKFAATNSDTREMARQQNLYRREIGFYRDIGQEVGIRVPQCYYSHFDEETQFFVMLLEDMAPGEPSDQVQGTSRGTSREVVERFARLHAKWWNSDKLDDYDWAKWIINEMPMDEASARLRESITQVEKTGEFDRYPEMKRLMYLLPPLFRMQPAPPYPHSLTHGDLRSDNIIQPSEQGGEFCVLDWQLAGKGDPINDLARWLVQSISIEDRKATEQDLLKLYYDQLLAHGVTGYSYRKFINGYKMNLVVILVMFSMTMEGIDRSSDRAQALFHQFYSRLDSALVDWEIEKLLKALPLLLPFIKFSTWIKLLLKPKTGSSVQ